MSGHSKWHTIKHKKEKQDKKKGLIFSKLSRAISLAARQGGDPDSNFQLRLAIDQAKEVDMPKENIERAIQRGTGELAGGEIEEAVYEAFGPAGSALIIKVVTDNRNRTLSELRNTLKNHGGKMGQENSVLWRFEQKGVIRLLIDQPGENKEAIELKAIEAGAEDIKEEENEIIIFTSSTDLQKVKSALEQEKIKIDYAGIERFARNPVVLSSQEEEKLNQLCAELDDNPDVSDYYTNVK